MRAKGKVTNLIRSIQIYDQISISTEADEKYLATLGYSNKQSNPSLAVVYLKGILLLILNTAMVFKLINYRFIYEMITVEKLSLLIV